MRVVERSILTANSEIIDLRTLVPLLSGNRWVWRVLWMDAVGEPFRGVPLQQLGNEIAGMKLGLEMTFAELVDLSCVIGQSIDLVVVAAANGEDFNQRDLRDENFDNCLVYADIFDSSTVSLGISNRVPGNEEILRRFESF
ncbi:hypothetical protein ABZ863_09655 [Saccharomonospora sp. NPDC046836]|uniref:hypothetical protein n=1 Tax=Saccharomonospora sp. NPDC046836 TaxID=3156921 RepID=UPI0033D48D98